MTTSYEPWRGPEHDGACYGGICVYCHKTVRGILYYSRTLRWFAVPERQEIAFEKAHKFCHERTLQNEVCSVCRSPIAFYNNLKENWFCDADNPNLQKAWEKRLNRRHQGLSANDFQTTQQP